MQDTENNSKNQHAVDSKVIKQKMIEISASMTRSEAEADLIKEIIEQIAEATGQDKKTIRKAAKVFHRDEKDKALKEAEDVISFVEKYTQ